MSGRSEKETSKHLKDVSDYEILKPLYEMNRLYRESKTTPERNKSQSNDDNM